jgi:hypothetical protein
MDLKELGRGLSITSSAWGLLSGRFQHGNELGCKRRGKFLDQLSEYQVSNASCLLYGEKLIL